MTIGKKTNKTNDYSNHTQTIKLYCDILIYTDNNLSVIELKKQFSQKLKLLKVNNQISFKIIHIKSFNNIILFTLDILLIISPYKFVFLISILLSNNFRFTDIGKFKNIIISLLSKIIYF